jgi:hypothetical protein
MRKGKKGERDGMGQTTDGAPRYYRGVTPLGTTLVPGGALGTNVPH